MANEQLIRSLIRGSIHRAIQESVAAVLVLVAFAAILAYSEVGSTRYYGCLVILVGTGFIAGVVWSYALSYRLLKSHSPGDVEFWREACRAQATLLRMAPLWYCAPLFAGAVLFIAPQSSAELPPFALVLAVLVSVFAVVVALNRTAADKIDEIATLLTAS